MDDPVSGLFFDHSGWLVLRTPADHVRAWLWLTTNASTANCYFWLAYEIQRWRQACPLRSIKVFSKLFSVFIGMCGVTRVAILFVCPTAPWWALACIYIPLTIVNALTVYVLAKNHAVVDETLRAIFKAYSRGRL